MKPPERTLSNDEYRKLQREGLEKMVEMEKEKSDQQAVLRQEPPTTENLEPRHQRRCMGGEENAH
jgi:hypothetical protein